MKERPILFSGEMVRAILSGRKSQTRRIVNWRRLHAQAGLTFPSRCNLAFYTIMNSWALASPGENLMRCVECPFGVAGDRLWVKETFALHDHLEPPILYYRADDETKYESDGRWQPSIYMPRKFSRILLQVVRVRVERLQDISDRDAMSEGVQKDEHSDVGFWIGEMSGTARVMHANPRAAYSVLWDSIHGEGSWDQNPWVWVVEFKKI